MISKTKITNLKSLQLAKIQLKAELTKSKLEINDNLAEIKDNLFSFGGLNTGNGFSSLLNTSHKELSRIVSSFIISKWVNPKSDLIKKASIFFSSLFLQKYSSKLIKELKKLIPKHIQDKLNE